MVPVILCGGSGTRLWPVSRAHYPKQYCEFFDQSFLKTTYERLKSLDTPWVITTASMQNLTQKTIPIADEHLILEPFGKNTAPALALLCHKFLKLKQEDQVVGVFPSDHLIFNEKAFLKALEVAERQAHKNKIITLGVEPHKASTAYGYIEVDENKKLDSQEAISAFQVKSFREKPNLEIAKKYIKSKHFYWNAGIFVFKISTLIQAFELYMPELWSKISSLNQDNLEQVYANINSISIDYGVMEKANNIACVPGDFGWSDVGSWDEVARLFEEAPELKNQSKADLYSYMSSSNFVYSVKDKIIGLSNVNDLIVVDTPDSLLITQKGSSQSVKELQTLISESRPVHASNTYYEKRPWGNYEVLSESAECKVKKVSVLPYKSISYQSHQKRDELWVIVSGEGKLTLDDKVQSVKKNDVVTILRKTKHQIECTSDIPLILIEVQTGDYFGEDDIERYES
ncbi:MAG: mannose-1-phosphate guanylyltransferase/mannose-6-phosphate isomerase [Bdellovibrionales bacterium]|nr:mannose-1-phosphate guanylyltransferase/mannose-6-phosphate isomerase [Bdellovibrionales bacterium]